MRHNPSQLRVAATRRRMMAASKAPADHSTHTLAPTQAGLAMRHAACWGEVLAIRLTGALFHSRPSYPPAPQTNLTARASSDFTAQVMARLSTPPPEPDPREARAKRVRAHMRRFTRIYIALVLISGVALLALAAFSPRILFGMVSSIVSLALAVMAFATLIGRLTNGVISGFGLAYVAMLAALALPLAVLARRTARGRYASTRRL